MEIKYNGKNELELPVAKSLNRNIEALTDIFSDWGDFVKKQFTLERENGTLRIYIIYIDGLTDNEMVERTITRPLLYEWRDTDFEKEKMHPSLTACFIIRRKRWI